MTLSKEHSDRGASLLPGEERRRSQRVVIRVPVTIVGIVRDQELTISACTVAVNIHGAMLLSPRPLDSGTLVEIENQRTRQRVTARVTRAPRESVEGYLIPLEFSAPTPAFWQITFPPANWKPSES
jgi:hypothetical protein